MRRKLENNLPNTYIHSSQLEAFSKSFWKVPAVRKRDMRDQNVIQSCLQIRISQSDNYEYLKRTNTNDSIRQIEFASGVELWLLSIIYHSEGSGISMILSQMNERKPRFKQMSTFPFENETVPNHFLLPVTWFCRHPFKNQKDTDCLALPPILALSAHWLTSPTGCFFCSVPNDTIQYKTLKEEAHNIYN